ncbi:Prolyl 4-hydroxylase subunit alpha-2 [Portunus trituberculatus]|uniref:Prolyl 4-hydroxylase subunit alpha-2 n=1 Tax=Portunus trituberculatus TaxID=210409 RepID=A0A5B7JII3_PORTR|nr:Prolyl 4-hydroxylase subunit alpha-2 [Portunus trituberculatus]
MDSFLDVPISSSQVSPGVRDPFVTVMVGWLDDSQNPLVAKLSDRVARLTRLSTSVTNDDAEMLQVANYGIGGHYNPHHDYLLVDKTEEEVRNLSQCLDRYFRFVYFFRAHVSFPVYIDRHHDDLVNPASQYVSWLIQVELDA